MILKEPGKNYWSSVFVFELPVKVVCLLVKLYDSTGFDHDRNRNEHLSMLLYEIIKKENGYSQYYW